MNKQYLSGGEKRELPDFDDSRKPTGAPKASDSGKNKNDQIKADIDRLAAKPDGPTRSDIIELQKKYRDNDEIVESILKSNAKKHRHKI